MNNIQNFLIRFWRGEARLWQAFWLCAFIGKFLVFAVIGFIGFLIWHSPQDNNLTNVVLGIPLLAYVVFALVSVWRCSKNVDLAPLGALAKVLVVFAVIGWIRLAAQSL